MLKYLLLHILLLLTYNNDNANSASIPILSDIQDIVNLANDITSVINGNIPFKNLFVKTTDPATVALEKLDAITQQVSQLAQDVSDKMDTILEVMLEQIPLKVDISAGMRDFHLQITRIDSLFYDFVAFMNDTDGFNDRTLNNFLDAITNTRANDLPLVLDEMHHLFVLSRSAAIRESLLDLLAQSFKATPEEKICNTPFSFQERIYEIFNLIAVSEMRGYVMTMFAYETLASKHNSSFAREVQKATARYVLRTEEYIMTTQRIMKKVSRITYRCDPPEYIRGQTFVELQGLFTGYFLNEYQGLSSDSCSEDCSGIDTMKTYRCNRWQSEYGPNQKYCPVRECLGRAYLCSWTGNTEICENPKQDLKRYRWAKTENGLYGTQTDCKTVRTNNHPGGFFNRCDQCVCRCVETLADSPAIRAINLMPQIANTAENKAVANIRFTMKDKMIFIQIAEAPFLPQAQVDINETYWVDVGNFEYIKEQPNGGFVKKGSGEKTPMKNTVDYSFITDKQRSFNFDQVLLPDDYVLTGIRMNHVKPGDKNSAIQIELHGTKFNFSSGKLNTAETIWVTPKSQPKPDERYNEKRTEVNYGKKWVPYKSPKNAPFSEVNEFVLFSPSNVWDDVGQTTVPLFDAQPVGINRTLSLGGVSTYFRSRKDYGGFIAMKIFNVNLSAHMNAVMKKKALKQYQKLYRDRLVDKPPTKP